MKAILIAIALLVAAPAWGDQIQQCENLARGIKAKIDAGMTPEQALALKSNPAFARGLDICERGGNADSLNATFDQADRLNSLANTIAVRAARRAVEDGK